MAWCLVEHRTNFTLYPITTYHTYTLCINRQNRGGKVSWTKFHDPPSTLLVVLFFKCYCQAMQCAAECYTTSHSVTTSSRVLLEKLTVTQLVKTFPAFYRTQRLITVFTKAWHWSLSWARCIHSTPSHPISLGAIVILSCHQADEISELNYKWHMSNY